jgi:hypothetical protein
MKTQVFFVFLFLVISVNVFSYQAIPAYARQVCAQPTPSTVTSSGSPTYLSQRSTIQLGGYYYVFYLALGGTNYGYLCYRSSTDGSTWGNENLASHVALMTTQQNPASPIEMSTDFDVFTDGSTVYVAYPVGTFRPYDYEGYTIANTTGYVRTGTQSNGTITWNTQVQIAQTLQPFAGWAWDFTQTTNRIYLAVRVYAEPYHIEVYYSADSGSSWTKSFDYKTGDQNWACGIAISSWDFQHTDGVVLVDGEYTEPYFNCWTFNGTDWSAKSTFGSKTGSFIQSDSNYVNSQCMSMVTHNNQVHFACIPSISGGAISYQYFTTSWSSATIVDSSTCMDPSLSVTLSSSLYMFYRIGSTLYYRAMDYSSNSWDDSATTFESGETSPCYLTSEQYSNTQSVGVVWQSGSSNPFNVRFACILYPTVLTLSLNSPTSLLGFKVNLNGTLQLNETRIGNAPILLSYSITGGQTWNDITLATTSFDGSYLAVWIPSATGTYMVKASAGNATFASPEILRALSVTSFSDQYVFSVSSNSTLSALAFNSTSRELSFTVSGPSGTTGFVDVAIAKNLVADITSLKVYLDGSSMNYTATSTSDSWLLHFTYSHSTHSVRIDIGSQRNLGLTPFIETPLGMVILSIGIIVAIAVLLLVFRRKRRKKYNLK